MTTIRSLPFHVRIVLVLVASLALLACNADTRSGEAADSATSGASEWQSLVTLDAWRGYQSDSMPPDWTVEDGVLTKSGVGSDIVSRNHYADFEWELEWMLDSGGNAGLFYRATEEYEKIYWSAPEYALLDDARHPDGTNPLTTAGAVHSLYAPPPGIAKGPGEWNSTRIVVRGTHAEHWLNGHKVAEYEYGSNEFNERVANSKFRDWPNFAKATHGVLGIQGDHTGVLRIRNMRVRPLSSQ